MGANFVMAVDASAAWENFYWVQKHLDLKT